MKMLNPRHPGEILQDNLGAVGLSPKRISTHLGFEPQTLIRVLEGNAAMSIELAQALEQYGWSNADFWMRLQANYEAAQALRRQQAIPYHRSSKTT